MAATETDIRNRLLLARLPAMPQILLRLMALCQTDEAGMAELAELVGSDAAMTSKVLTIASSAAYHRGNGSPDLLRALNTLGADMLKTLVISESVFQTFNGFPHARGVDLRAFWQHSLGAAVMARELARHMDYAHPEEAYLAGLLHDVGRLALLAAAPHEYGVNFLARDDQALCAVEQRGLDITHAEAGAWLIERWQFDSFLADSALYHHEEEARISIGHPLIRIVHLADRLANLPADATLPAGSGALCGVADTVLDAVREVAGAQVRREAELLGIDLSVAPEPAGAAVEIAPPVPVPADAARQQLHDEVRDAALAAELGQMLAREKDPNRLLDRLCQSARLLFQLDDSVILRLDESGTALTAWAADARHQRVRDLSWPLAGGGLLAERVLSRRPSCLVRTEDTLGVIEEQLLRLFGQDALLCVPLVIGSRCLGALVAGIASWRVAELRARERLLQAFGARAAAALETLLRESAAQDQALAGLREDYQLHSRKVAHEVNNPLGLMKNYLSVLDDKLARSEPVREELAILNEEIDRIGRIMVDFSDAAPAQRLGRADLNRSLRELARLFHGSRFLPAGVQIAVRAPETPALTATEPDALKQILLNLVKNAVRALPGGGQVELVNHGPAYRDGRIYHRLEVRDNGPGLPAPVLERLFTPLPADRGEGGQGLGLSIVHDLVSQSGGSITCASGPAGTAFDILLPALAAVKNE